MTARTQDNNKIPYSSLLKQVDTLSLSNKKNLLLFLRKNLFLESLNNIRKATKNIDITFDEITALVEEVRSERYKNQKKK